jgi:hypothetical protein
MCSSILVSQMWGQFGLIRYRIGCNSEKLLNNPLPFKRDAKVSRKKEVIELERKTKMLMVSTVLVLAVLSGIAAMAYASRGTTGIDALVTYANGVTNDTGFVINDTSIPGDFRGGMHGFFGRQPRGCGPGESITVSQEFKDNVINITESDSDVQTLLAEGYNVTGVRPIINITVEGDGTVTMKATKAIVTLSQNTTGRATVWVDIEQAKVTRIEILSITVIDKS